MDRRRELCLHVANHIVDAPARDTRTEELRGQVRNLMRLIEDQRVGRAEQVTEAVFLQREVREQQMVVDDHNIRLLR